MASFETLRTLRFGDCDPAGIAYFPFYFHFLNGVHEEWWISLGFPWRILIQERRIGLPTAQLDTRFLAPGFMGDVMNFTLEVEKIGPRSMALDYTVSRDETVLWKAAQVVVPTNLDTHKSIAWPQDILAALRTFQENPGHV